MQAIGLPINLWETLASDRSEWRTSCTKALREGGKLLHITVDTRREHQNARVLAAPTDSTYFCGSDVTFVDQELDSKASSENV